MESIVVEVMHYKGQARIAIGMPFNNRLNTIVGKIAGARWSRSLRKWHLPDDNNLLKQLLKQLSTHALIDVSALRQFIESRSDQPSQTAIVKLEREKVFIEPVSIRFRFSIENQMAFESYCELLIIKGYSPKTIKTYRYEFSRFLQLISNVPADHLDASHIKRYMHYCATMEHLSENSLHSRLNAIKFYYEQVLLQDKILWDIPRAKRPFILPKVLSEQELRRMFSAVPNLKHKAILFTAYSAGLRVSEVVALKVGDVDSDRMQLFIRRAKGKKDRIVNLSVLLLDLLRQYIKQENPRPVQYLFGVDGGTRPYSDRSAQAIFQRAKNMAGIKKAVSFHSLRHSFATHLLEKGIDVKYIKDLLGHFDIRTTERYLHVSKDKLINIPSPLDFLYDGEI